MDATRLSQELGALRDQVSALEAGQDNLVRAIGELAPLLGTVIEELRLLSQAASAEGPASDLGPELRRLAEAVDGNTAAVTALLRQLPVSPAEEGAGPPA
ncbi:hypothetical protein CR162_18380 [Pseudoroseomonas rhizosphaerae]|uniref:Uncharacterized protein n=1 Tax=Teichococcus rhizosphaerae TaxID=1335062 RepID=A0A2C6XY27_9PROT|nr:hypothetical protein [Pseudoroseomonas rhizosphaerae]PHK93442.1 hypothetical protein CR162_18380 [Pseudoroseomonas rhizosphaerae]